jgi:hypothetical protein
MRDVERTGEDQRTADEMQEWASKQMEILGKK